MSPVLIERLGWRRTATVSVHLQPRRKIALTKKPVVIWMFYFERTAYKDFLILDLNYWNCPEL